MYTILSRLDKIESMLETKYRGKPEPPASPPMKKECNPFGKWPAKKTFDIAAIEGVRKTNKGNQYLIHWKDCDDPDSFTWETHEHMFGKEDDADRQLIVKFNKVMEGFVEELSKKNPSSFQPLKTLCVAMAVKAGVITDRRQLLLAKSTNGSVVKVGDTEFPYTVIENDKKFKFETPYSITPSYQVAKAFLGVNFPEALIIDEALGQCKGKECMKELVKVKAEEKPVDDVEIE